MPAVNPRWIVAGLLGAAVLAAAWWVRYRVDLTPQVGADFFFASDDPALRAAAEIDRLFPARPQILIAATAEDLAAQETLDRIRQLTEALATLDGVASVQSLTRGPRRPEKVEDSPLWSRLLLVADNPRVTNLVVSVAADADPGLVPAVEAVVAEHERPSFRLEVSGVPYVVAHIRRQLRRDLEVFSLAALGVFGLMVLLIYRSWRIVAGTLISCVGASLITLSLLAAFGTGIGVLTANIVTIVFVLTLSHVVFLTANWRSLPAERTASQAAAAAVSLTITPSFWCMVTTLLGFVSLLFANAQPLRELAMAGVVGTAVALIIAFGLYPAFLGSTVGGKTAGNGEMEGEKEGEEKEEGANARPPRWRWVVIAALLCGGMAWGMPRIVTDPSLLAYFDADGEIYRGLRFIDHNGGSSPLDLVVGDPQGARLDNEEAILQLAQLQAALEGEPAVGLSLSLPVLIGEARQVPFAFFFTDAKLIDRLEGEDYDRVARSFITEDRTRARYFLRLREDGRAVSRQTILDSLAAHVAAAGLELEHMGGIYDLEAKLGALVASGLLRGLGALLFLFVFIAVVISRSARTTIAMALSLAAVPVVLLGTFGWSGLPVDFISSPAANVAIALGIDAMIHLVTAVRRRRTAGASDVEAWALARAQLWRPILGAVLILAFGFGIFALSSFPPTRRFGLAVALGTLTAGAMALTVLPPLAAGRISRTKSVQGSR